MITLHRVCPWNRDLPRGVGHRYTEQDNRKFAAKLVGGLWLVDEVGDDGLMPGWRDLPVSDYAALKALAETNSAGVAFNLAGVRVAIERYLAGDTPEQIAAAVAAVPRPGTGRNHPRRVAHRRTNPRR